MSNSEGLYTNTRGFLGMILILLSVLAGLSLFSYNWQDISILSVPVNQSFNNRIGPAGAWFSFIVLMLFGTGAFVLPLAIIIIGVYLLVKPHESIKIRAFCLFFALLSLSILFQLYPQWSKFLCSKLNISGLPGGMLGLFTGTLFLKSLLGITGATILAAGILAICIFILIGKEQIGKICCRIGSFIIAVFRYCKTKIVVRQEKIKQIASEEWQIAKEQSKLQNKISKQKKGSETSRTLKNKTQKKDTKENQSSQPEFNAVNPNEGTNELESKKSGHPGVSQGILEFPEYKLPPVSLLKSLQAGDDAAIAGDIHTTARILQETLNEFGIEAKVTNIEQGPVVTRYELLPARGIRVEKISQLSNNLALTLKATSVRVQAPIPGKGVVGIEVPNTSTAMVTLRDILESKKWKNSTAALPLMFGKDVSGNALVADLASMPHLLIAGATGSGKTVCINSILAGLLMSRTPDQLRLMLIDPKIVEFSTYKKIPHLIAPVITNAKKVSIGLHWAITEMEQRYNQFAQIGVRTIQAYNNKIQQYINTNAQIEKDSEELPGHLPYLVIVIDELADLMLTAQAEVENAIARLAQLSRAVGIHMIIATQRPSVNVITGTIKANFPARISFQVAQKVDSRTILDTGGADKLLGKGDMLILPSGTSRLIRAQGAYTSDEDINAIVDFVTQQAEPRYGITITERLKEGKSPTQTSAEGADAELLNAAINVIRETHRASVSLLQRRLKIGYNRAGRLMDQLEDQGIVGPAHGSDPREILVDLDSEETFNSNN
jgi:DNA segregation ATPase FtsK/SpoIIIE, S-DNA-T family